MCFSLHCTASLCVRNEFAITSTASLGKPWMIMEKMLGLCGESKSLWSNVLSLEGDNSIQVSFKDQRSFNA